MLQHLLAGTIFAVGLMGVIYELPALLRARDDFLTIRAFLWSSGSAVRFAISVVIVWMTVHYW